MTGKTAQCIKVLGLVGSRRRLGNCELVVKEISRRIEADHALDLIRLPDLDIRPCNGCYRCISDGVCGIGDDASFLVDRVASADALIIASPVYFLGTHGSVKMLLDRAFSFFPVFDKLPRKPAVLVNTYGMKDRIGTAPQALLAFAAFLGLEVRASVAMHAALPGEVLTKKGNLRTAGRLARALVGRALPRKRGRACPHCGCDIVRMTKDAFICTLCHGTFTIDGGGRTVALAEGWKVDDVEFVRAHREWLKGMKAVFMAKRKELARLALPYKDMGRWLSPR